MFFKLLMFYLYVFLFSYPTGNSTFVSSSQSPTSPPMPPPPPGGTSTSSTFISSSISTSTNVGGFVSFPSPPSPPPVGSCTTYVILIFTSCTDLSTLIIIRFIITGSSVSARLITTSGSPKVVNTPSIFPAFTFRSILIGQASHMA